MTELLDSISIEHWGAPEFYAYHKTYENAWNMGEPIPAGHASVGRLVIEPEVLAQAHTEVANLPHKIEIQKNREPRPGMLSPFLEEFVGACRQRFTELVVVDGQQYNPTDPEDNAYETIVGPYVYAPSNNWHFDQSEANGHAVYTLTVLGPTTLYANDHISNKDFNEEGDLLAPEKLKDTMCYPVGTATIHHGARTAHAVPGPEHSGKPRLFMNHRLYSAFTDPM